MGQKESSLIVKVKVDGEEELEIKGYRVHRGRCALACLFVAFTLGLLLILIAWRRDIKMCMFYQECPLQHATKVLVKVKLSLNFLKETISQNMLKSLGCLWHIPRRKC